MGGKSGNGNKGEKGGRENGDRGPGFSEHVDKKDFGPVVDTIPPPKPPQEKKE